MCSYTKIVKDSQILRYEFQDLSLSVWDNTTVVYTLKGVAIFIKEKSRKCLFLSKLF